MRARNVACGAVHFLPLSFDFRSPPSDIDFSILVALLYKRLRQLIFPADVKICRDTTGSASCITNTRTGFTPTQRTSRSPPYRTFVLTMFPIGTSAVISDTDPSDAHTNQPPTLSAVSRVAADHSRMHEQFVTGQFSMLEEPRTEQVMNNNEEVEQANIIDESDDINGSSDNDDIQIYTDTETGQVFVQLLIPIPHIDSVDTKSTTRIVIERGLYHEMPTPEVVEKPTGKCIVVCCDGTWNNAAGTQYPVTNVGRLARCLSHETRNRKPHVVYYSSGVGTTATPIGNMIQGAFGEGKCKTKPHI